MTQRGIQEVEPRVPECETQLKHFYISLAKLQKCWKQWILIHMVRGKALRRLNVGSEVDSLFPINQSFVGNFRQRYLAATHSAHWQKKKCVRLKVYSYVTPLNLGVISSVAIENWQKYLERSHNCPSWRGDIKLYSTKWEYDEETKGYYIPSSPCACAHH